MNARRISPAEQFAEDSDAMLGLGAPRLLTDPAEPALLQLAKGLRQLTREAPDPVFAEGLRESLRQHALDARTAVPTALSWASLQTPLGLLGVVQRAGKIVYCSALVSEREFELRAERTLGAPLQREDRLPEPLARSIQDHISGTRRMRALDLSWLPSFQRRVLEKISEIPRGEVRPYAWVAREIGAPGAVRAVGTALGHNPIPFLVPCHRVVRADGSLGEYSGGGPQAKQQVLAFEGAPVQELQQRAQRGERLTGSRTTHIFCYPSCHAARRIRSENEISFATTGKAAAAGYRPCKLCRPA